jgi:hypothetical protein
VPDGSKPKPYEGREKHNGSERRHVPGLVLPFLVRELLSELTAAEWLVWSVLFLHSNREGLCCLKNETIIAETGIGIGAFHIAKRGLLKKRWAENCGQKEGRGPNVYRVRIPTPKPIEDFLCVLWDKLNCEKWWNEGFGSDRFDFSDSQLDWLLAWRAIRILKESDLALTGNTKNRKPWTPRERINPELQHAAQELLLRKLRHAGASLNQDRGLWWLFGDGFDAAKL